MKDQNMNSSYIPINKGIEESSDLLLRCSDSEGRHSLARATSPPLPMAYCELDSTQHIEGGDFALSSEERRLISLVVAGYSNKELARHFALSKSTIYRRAIRILDKVGAANRFELVLVAIFYGISADA
jgi:DNA-binding NarL/FixJ family response regulator